VIAPSIGERDLGVNQRVNWECGAVIGGGKFEFGVSEWLPHWMFLLVPGQELATTYKGQTIC